MGEYASYNRQQIKIGTCENMYYLRWDDRRKVQRLPGNVNPARNPEGLRFRLPFPDEDANGPGNYEPFRSLTLPGFVPDEDLEPGRYQVCHKESGLLLNIDCHHGIKLPDVGASAKAHWNGKKAHWFELCFVKHCEDGLLRPIVKCSVCGDMWRFDWEPVLAAVADSPMRDRLAAYAAIQPAALTLA